MGKQVESWQSDDGVLFTDEKAMLLHEVKIALEEKLPEVKMAIPSLLAKAQGVSEILAPLVDYYRKNHPDESVNTTREMLKHTAADGTPLPPVAVDEEDRGGCDCSALLAGNGGEHHHPTCPMHREYRPSVAPAVNRFLGRRPYRAPDTNVETLSDG